MSVPLEDHALIGDGETACLVTRDGVVDWLCWPRFDSEACFCGLLGGEDDGLWSIAPAAGVLARRRRYRDGTLVLETEFETATGEVRVIDFMPVPRTSGTSSLVRIVEGIRGEVDMRSDLRLRFDYGALPPWSEPSEGGMVARVGPNVVTLCASVPVTIEAGRTHAVFRMDAGTRTTFVLQHVSSPGTEPPPLDPAESLSETEEDWRAWVARFDRSRTEWPDVVTRSLITLRALIHRAGGGMVAAPTTSLPEAPGGAMNWDYRYCWLRDATFTVSALLDAGFKEEAVRWRDWLLRAIARSPDQLRIMYRVDGSRHLDEWEVSHLDGYRFSRPVRVGNAASTQRQVDILGEVIECLHLARQGGLEATPQERHLIGAIADRVTKMWGSAGSGLWESRGEDRRYTYSEAMAWVALDRAVKMEPDDARAGAWGALRDRIHAVVCREGWNEGLGTFTQYFGGQTLDASLLLLPIVGFLPVGDRRIASTIETIRRELSEGGLIRRKQAKPGGVQEGAFLACSCWMADCLRMQGRTDEARAQFERVLTVANDLGLLSEEYDVRAQHLSGNFPQALTHLAVVNTALGLCGPVLHRGGG